MATPSPQLYMKSYYAHSVSEAIQAAKSEMGLDAMLLNSTPTRADERYRGDLEVVFGKYKEPEPARSEKPPAAGPASMDELRERLDRVCSLLTRQNTAAAAVARNPLPQVETSLVEGGLDSDLAAEMGHLVAERLAARPYASWTPGDIRRETAGVLQDRLSFISELSPITAFVGPPGVGKTTTLVKLAIIQGLAVSRQVRIISADTQRIGAAGQLRTYADILGMPFQAVGSPAELADALDNSPARSLTMIDTAGFSPALMDDLGGDFANFLSRRQDIDTHLVLTASAHRSHLSLAADRFERFRPKRIIFTQLDEAPSFGAMYSLAARLGKPLSYLCSGQLIPEDIEVASSGRLMDNLLRCLPADQEN